MDIAPESRLPFIQVLLRSVAVGFVYAIASALAAWVLGPLSRLAPNLSNIAVWTLSGTLVALALSPFILHSAWSHRDTVLAAWAAMAFVRSLGLGIEGSLFKPTEMTNAILGAVSGILIALLVAWLSALLFLPTQPVSPRAAGLRYGTWRLVAGVVLVGIAYFVFYFVFGATNALLYTRSFYENNPQYGLTLPPTGVIFIAQLLRGPLFGLGSLFLVLAADAPRRRLAIWLGLLLFIVGGVGPYLEVTFRTMPIGFNLATLAEIFLQNFLTGIVAVYVLKRRTPASL